MEKRIKDFLPINIRQIKEDNGMNYEKTIKQVIEFSEKFYNSLDFAHNMEHGERVVKNAKTIAKKEGGDLFLIEIGSWLHQFHDNINEVNKNIRYRR